MFQRVSNITEAQKKWRRTLVQKLSNRFSENNVLTYRNRSINESVEIHQRQVFEISR